MQSCEKKTAIQQLRTQLKLAEQKGVLTDLIINENCVFIFCVDTTSDKQMRALFEYLKKTYKNYIKEIYFLGKYTIKIYFLGKYD